MDEIISISHNNERGDHATIEVEDGNDAIEVEDGTDPVVISIQDMLYSLPHLSPECCIYTVPENLRKINAEAYTPIVVSIGPLHRNVERLKAMEEHKLRYLDSFVSRSGWHLEDYVKFIRGKEKDIRNCYAENIELKRDEFVQMILVDGCFLVEFMLRFNFISASVSGAALDNIGRVFDHTPGKHIEDMKNQVDRIMDKPGLLVQIKRDLLLLENQLPLFVLEDLFRQWRVSSGLKCDISFMELCPLFFKILTGMDELPGGFTIRQVEHFVHFVLLHYFPACETEEENHNIPEIPPTATQLHEAGVKFKSGKINRLLGMNFEKAKGVLEISHLPVYDMTETVLRNLIAFELCHRLDGTIMDYMQLMDGLIDTPKDVDLLIKANIITSNLGRSEKVFKMINNICKEVYMSQKSYNQTLCKDLNNYRQTHKHQWKPILRLWRHNYFDTLTRDYFDTPWKTVSIIAAIILLSLTFIQAVCSILSV